MATLRCGDQDLPLTFTNHFLAHLQVAVHRRFSRGGGFFLTGTYPNHDDKEVTVSRWVGPTTQLVFVYDVRDDSNERIPPVELDDNQIDGLLEAMDRPAGVHETTEVWLTFREKI